MNYWIELTKEEVEDIFTTVMNRLDAGYIPSQEFAKAIEAKVIEKNQHLVEDRVIWRNEAYRWMHRSGELEQELKNATRLV